MTPIDHEELKRLLSSVGKKAYVEILFPAMTKDRDISVMELCQKYPEFRNYTPAAQNTRRTKARKIFDNGWQYEALHAIALSSRVIPSVRAKAQEFLQIFHF